MSVIQSGSGIEAAARTHKYLFWGYIFLLIFTAIFTWLVWKSGNNLQGAVRKDADARIAEALEAAAKANARADELENQNLLLQTELTKLQIELAETHDRVQETRRKLDPRVFTPISRAAFIRKAGETKGTIDIVFLGEPKSESSDFTREVARALKEAGWTVNTVERVPLADLHLITNDLLAKHSIEAIGLAVILERRGTFEDGRAAAFLREALALGGFWLPICRVDERAGKPPLLLVGPKRLKS